MIGVVAAADERPVVEEFFELFKTPWEFYERGRVYDVVIATAGHVPAVDAPLVVIYGSDTKNTDAAHNIWAGARHRGATLNVGGTQLPIYGELLTFAKRQDGAAFLETSGAAAGLTNRHGQRVIKRLGYDLFREVRFLLSEGQPLEHAHLPTLDIHVSMLRAWILEAGIPLEEIPPVPADHSFVVCLTHDIDFTGIRHHLFDHTMWGFLYRSTIGAARNLLKRRISIGRFVKMWAAAVSLPCVYLRWMPDHWRPFEWYPEVEKNLPATYFIIPVKRRAGEFVGGRHPSRRATAYDIGDIAESAADLMQQGCEVAVHGIDAWHSVDKGKAERARVVAVTGAATVGIRMHWLLRGPNTATVLEQAGYAYDAGLGYNETIGYRNGTTQVFRPCGARKLLGLPLHIQDTALFSPQRLDLSEPEARRRCDALVDNARRSGGVLTVLWHDRSHGPERLWGDFYADFVRMLQSLDGWFGTAAQVVRWFDERRAIRFARIDTEDGPRMRVCYRGAEIQPPVSIRVHRPGTAPIDLRWNGQSDVELDSDERAPDVTVQRFASMGSVQ